MLPSYRGLRFEESTEGPCWIRTFWIAKSKILRLFRVTWPLMGPPSRFQISLWESCDFERKPIWVRTSFIKELERVSLSFEMGSEISRLCQILRSSRVIF